MSIGYTFTFTSSGNTAAYFPVDIWPPTPPAKRLWPDRKRARIGWKAVGRQGRPNGRVVTVFGGRYP